MTLRSRYNDFGSVTTRNFTRPWASAWTAVLAASAAVIGSFMPWARSGQTSRTSYELIGVAGRLDVLDGGWARLAALWLLVPVATGLAWLALSFSRSRLAATLAASVGLQAVAAAALTERSPLAAETGVTVGRWAGSVALAAAAIHLLMTRSPAHER